MKKNRHEFFVLQAISERLSEIYFPDELLTEIKNLIDKEILPKDAKTIKYLRDFNYPYHFIFFAIAAQRAIISLKNKHLEELDNISDYI